MIAPLSPGDAAPAVNLNMDTDTGDDVDSTWRASFDQMRSASPEASELVLFISQIEPRAIPEAMLPRAGTEDDFATAVDALCAHAFLARRQEAEDEAPLLDMPASVHRATAAWLEREDAAVSTLERAAAHLVRVFPTDEWANRSTWRLYLPHATRLLRAGNALGPLALSRDASWNLCELAFWAGRCLRADGRARTSADLVAPFVAAQERLLPEDDAYLLSWQHSLAITYDDADRVDEAVPLLEHVVRVRDRLFPEDHASRLASRHTLARAYKSAGRLADAIALLRAVVAVEAATLAPDHDSLLVSRQLLASALDAAGHPREAADLTEQVLAVTAARLPDEHPVLLSSRSTLASAYRALGRRDDAFPLCELVAAMWGRTQAEDHPDRLAAEYRLAVAYADQERFADAVALLTRIVAVQERCLPADHSLQGTPRAALVKWQYVLDKRERV